MLTQKAPLQISGQPHLGIDLLAVRSDRRRPAPEHAVEVAPPPRLGDDLVIPLVLAVNGLTDELRGLRQDLAARSLEARWRRLRDWIHQQRVAVWHWMRGVRDDR